MISTGSMKKISKKLKEKLQTATVALQMQLKEESHLALSWALSPIFIYLSDPYRQPLCAEGLGAIRCHKEYTDWDFWLQGAYSFRKASGFNTYFLYL